MTFIRKVRLENLLSFGPAGQELDLGPLNVLIGRNGSGKSNLPIPRYPRSLATTQHSMVISGVVDDKQFLAVYG